MPRRPDGALLRVLAVTAVVHGALLLYDLGHPAAFLEGDRAQQRLDRVETLVATARSGGDVGRHLVEVGGPGDFAIHGALYGMGGQYLVIAAQIVLGLGAVALTYLLGREVGLRPGAAAAGALVYAALPGSLLHPHVLVSEALFNPLVVASTYFSARALSRAQGAGHLVAAGLAATAATMVRLVFALFPAVFAAILAGLPDQKQRLRRAAIYLLMAFSGLLVWEGYALVKTGHLSESETGHDLAYNLYGRVERMARVEDFRIDARHQAGERLDPAAYLRYLWAHPGPYAATVLSDTANLVLNSGVNSFAGRYLNLFHVSDDTRYWRRLRDQQGLLAMVAEMARRSPALFVSNVAATAAWVAFLSLAVLGLWRLSVSGRVLPGHKLLLLALVGYVLLASQASMQFRWHLRTPIEFVLALAVPLGWRWVMDVAGAFFRSWKGSSSASGRSSGQSA